MCNGKFEGSSSKMIDTNNTKEKFWNMFVIDDIIGNTDRHNGNWGFILNDKTNEIKFAPIYDCGSCLNPMLEDEEMKKLNEKELKNIFEEGELEEKSNVEKIDIAGSDKSVKIYNLNVINVKK